MLLDFLRYFWLRNATGNQISNILRKENFVYLPEDIDNLLKGNQKGIRYGNIVLIRNENNHQVKRFFKVMLDGTLRTFRLFRRQVEISNALNKDEKFNSPTIEVLKYSFNNRVPYGIFETREDGNNFGFMHDNPAFYEKFSEQDMQNLVRSIYSFHNAGLEMDLKIWKYTQNISSDFLYHKKQILNDLDQKITHKTVNGKTTENSVRELIETYTGLQKIDALVENVLDKNWEKVLSSRIKNKKYLVHADMQIDNVYKHKDGTFELLDFEWVGGSDNPVIAIMYDYGNLRARAWSSPAFQELLDKKMLDVGKIYYKDINIINAGLTLGMLRSSIMMARFHMDFINTVKKDKRTEQDYQNMYPKTLSTLTQVLKHGLTE